MNPDQIEPTRIGLSLVTSACLDADRISDENLALVLQGIEEDPEFEAKAMVGLTNVAIWLLVLLEKETGRPMQSFLEHMGRKIAAGELDA